jgi:hypothetical protein
MRMFVGEYTFVITATGRASINQCSPNTLQDLTVRRTGSPGIGGQPELIVVRQRGTRRLTRVAAHRSRIVNSSAGGSSKDTWILTDGRHQTAS